MNIMYRGSYMYQWHHVMTHTKASSINDRSHSKMGNTSEMCSMVQDKRSTHVRWQFFPILVSPITTGSSIVFHWNCSNPFLHSCVDLVYRTELMFWCEGERNCGVCYIHIRLEKMARIYLCSFSNRTQLSYGWWEIYDMYLCLTN